MEGQKKTDDEDGLQIVQWRGGNGETQVIIEVKQPTGPTIDIQTLGKNTSSGQHIANGCDTIEIRIVAPSSRMCEEQTPEVLEAIREWQFPDDLQARFDNVNKYQIKSTSSKNHPKRLYLRQDESFHWHPVEVERTHDWDLNVHGGILLHLQQGTRKHAPYTCAEGETIQGYPRQLSEDALSGKKKRKAQNTTDDVYKTLYIVVPSEKPDDTDAQQHTRTLSVPLWTWAMKMVKRKGGVSEAVSILQKTIRRRAVQVDVRNIGTFSGPDVIRALVWALASPECPPVYYPNLHKSVRGITQLFKRAGIIGAEDAHLAANEVCSLLTCALLSSIAPTWRPGPKVMQHLLTLLLTAHGQAECWEYDAVHPHADDERVAWNRRPSTYTGADEWWCAAMLLKTVGGMEGDQRMLRDLALTGGRTERTGIFDPSSTVGCADPCMCVAVGYDIHIEPTTIACVEYSSTHSPDVLDTLPASGAPYKGVLFDAFRHLSGQNPRRGWQLDKPLTETQQRLLDTMRAIYDSRHNGYPASGTGTGTGTLNLVLSPAMLAGMVSAQLVRIGKRTFVVCLHGNTLEPSVTTKPSRNKSSQVKPTPEERDKAVAKAMEDWEKPAIVAHKKSLPAACKQAEVRLNAAGQWELRRTAQDSWAPWTSVATRSVPYTGLQTVPNDTAIWQALQTCRPHWNAIVLQRLVVLLQTNDATVALPSVQRDGSGSKNPAMAVDAFVYQVLNTLSQHFPDVLRRVSLFKYRAPDDLLRGQLLHGVRSALQHLDQGHALTHQLPPLSMPHDSLTDSQQRTVQHLVNHYGQPELPLIAYLLASTGYGKTRCALAVYQNLQASESRDLHKLSGKGLLWTVPKTAFFTIAKDMVRTQMPSGTIFIVRPFKRSKAPKSPPIPTELRGHVQYVYLGDPEPFCFAGKMVLIDHEALRRSMPVLLREIGNLMFVVDEAHKVLNATLRTQCARLLIASACCTLMMSATPVLNTDMAPLAELLNGTVPFRVCTSTALYAAVATIVVGDTAPPGRRIHLDVDANHRLTEQDKAQMATQIAPRHSTFLDFPSPSDPPILNYRRALDTSVDVARAEMCAIVTHLIQLHTTMSVQDALRIEQNIQERYPDADSVPPYQEMTRLPHRVLLVASDARVALQYWDTLVQQNGVQAGDILLVGKTYDSSETAGRPGLRAVATVDFTEQSTEPGGEFAERTPRVLIVPKRVCAGWNGGGCTVLVRTWEPSNQADRTQMDGRIHRMNGVRQLRWYVRVVAGLMPVMLQYHNLAASWEKSIEQLANAANGSVEGSASGAACES